MGDGVLVEFASAVNAVACAVELQGKMARSATPMCPTSDGSNCALGVNLGDVIVEGSDLYGDGVNVAARLESIAEPGGVCSLWHGPGPCRQPARSHLRGY